MGGPLAPVRDGDVIALDVAARRLHLCLDEAEMERRWENWNQESVTIPRGFGHFYLEHMNQAPVGCDFEFLRGAMTVAAE